MVTCQSANQLKTSQLQSLYNNNNKKTFCCINLKQVEKTQKSAEAGYLKLLSSLDFIFICIFFFTVYEYRTSSQ